MSRTVFDLNDPAVIADPYPHYARLRDEAPVYHSSDPDLWILSRHDDVAVAVRDAQRFSSDLGKASRFDDNPFNPTMKIPHRLAGTLGRVVPLRTLLTSDPPEHTVLRRKVSRAFTPRRITAWQPRIREIAERLVDDIAAKAGPIDLVTDLASPLPTIVIAEMMGIPADRHDDFKRWSDNLVNGLLTGGSKAKMLTSAGEISWFFARTVRERRRNPGDDLVSLLVTGDADALSLVELINFCVLLLVAGNETTTNLISNAMLALFEHRDLWQQITADPSLAAAAVEEALRFDGPGQGLLRITTTDVTIGETTIPGGARVLPLIGSANRDPRHWEDPDEFRLDRNTNEHIAFGSGIHFCIGNALARIESRAAIEMLARRLPRLAPAGAPTRIASPVLRGLRSLPVEPSGRHRREPRIVIVGAGMAGIAAAHSFSRAGFTDFTILEKGSDVGGVWHWNRYPGLRCDVPSHTYQFAFAPKPDWKHVWATGKEIRQYHRDLVDRLHLRPHLRLDCEVTSAAFTDNHWRLSTADGENIDADFLVAATGVLHHPAIPDIPGLDSFAGPVVHTARWTDLDTAGRRVAVIGTGSTGVQVFSALQPAAAHITHFVRTPQWVMWMPMGLRQPRVVGRLLRVLPGLAWTVDRGQRIGSDLVVDLVTRPSWRRRLAQHYARLCLRIQVRDKDLRARLTPGYQPFCKRQVISASYYRRIAKPNASFVTEPIAAITPTGIQTADGTHHDVDVIVLATGFQAHNYMRPLNLRGRDGLSIDDAWAKGPRAWAMTAIPGFPNLFTVLGPNSPSGSMSLQHVAELTAHYITGWLRRFRDGEITSVEITEEATSRFADDVAEAMRPTVWNTGCNSWYFADDNHIDLWPFDRKRLTTMLTRPRDDDYILTS